MNSQKQSSRKYHYSIPILKTLINLNLKAVNNRKHVDVVLRKLWTDKSCPPENIIIPFLKTLISFINLVAVKGLPLLRYGWDFILDQCSNDTYCGFSF